MYPNHHCFPCLHCHPHSYIRMVQHLIERCLLLHMSRDQCIKALAVHASIRPLVTLTGYFNSHITMGACMPTPGTFTCTSGGSYKRRIGTSFKHIIFMLFLPGLSFLQVDVFKGYQDSQEGNINGCE